MRLRWVGSSQAYGIAWPGGRLSTYLQRAKGVGCFERVHLVGLSVLAAGTDGQ